MIYGFEVEGFKGFSDKLVFDLTQRKNYEFNQDCIFDGVVKKSLVYGKNGIGKSNLGLALFDIVAHLTEFNINDGMYNNYINAMNDSGIARFKYDFKFGDDIVTYTYGKRSIKELVYEELFINKKLVAKFDRVIDSNAYFSLSGTESLNTALAESKISIINYIKNNAVLNDSVEKNLFTKFIRFVDKMLYFRSLDSNNYLGLEMGRHLITPDIVERGNVDDFERFLNEAGVVCKLCVMKTQGNDGIVEDIGFDFGNKKIPFYGIASTGTKSLALFYYWLQRFKDDECVSFIFVDEFDAFYHHSLSMLIVREMKKAGAQVVITTHNTNVMTNELLRPDCYFIMDEKGVTPIYEKTDKELREAHNIEKMYKAGTFNG
ncbi:ATP-binding protein [Citrobacter sp. FDAARGOS_156]|uniref:AAA family ATPase n=1 Tax=Citrobacter sp. FDAARGOS_156 TaxID=1702170 RepID=UPI001900AD30|nr:ATP-binding protein [Citrobacter sp. FDAARGOS_156]MBJ9205755.1 ATP-binding protein [Citrobacter sp. FDAARGOS_156]